MTQTRVPAIAGWTTLAVIVVAAALWQLYPFGDRRPWVPTCTDLAPRMQSTVGGAWSVAEPDANRDKNQTSIICELAFTSADQRFSGTAQVFITGEADQGTSRREVTNAPCTGTTLPATLPAGYLALRACSLRRRRPTSPFLPPRSSGGCG